MKQKLSVIVALIVICILASACNANDAGKNDAVTVLHADYTIYNDARELVDAAEVVFTGKVTNVRYEYLNIRSSTEESDPDTGLSLDEEELLPYTIFSVEIIDVMKGETSDNVMEIKRAGGNFDDETYLLEDASEINQGKEYLFTVNTYDDSPASLLNVTQSSYDLNPSRSRSSQSTDNNISLDDIMSVLEE